MMVRIAQVRSRPKLAPAWMRPAFALRHAQPPEIGGAKIVVSRGISSLPPSLLPRSPNGAQRFCIGLRPGRRRVSPY
jgi:hypothetical protein